MKPLEWIKDYQSAGVFNLKDDAELRFVGKVIAGAFFDNPKPRSFKVYLVESGLVLLAAMLVVLWNDVQIIARWIRGLVA